MLAEYSSTTLAFWIRETRPCGDWGIPDSGFASRFPVHRSKLHHFNHSMRSSTASVHVFFILLGSVASLATASGQTSTRKPLRTEPLEKYNMPPAYIYRLETGPRMISPFGLFTSFQVNVDANGNNILGDAANEPSIAVDPTNPQQDASIGWRQFNSCYVRLPAGRAGDTPPMAGTTWNVPWCLGK